MVTTRLDPRIAAVLHERQLVPSGTPTAALDAVLAGALKTGTEQWSPTRLAQEVVEVASEMTAATQVVLYLYDGEVLRCMGLAPPHLASPLLCDQESDRFPWGMSSVQPRRFILIEDAGELPLSDSLKLRDLGLNGAVHLPMRDRGRLIGAMQLYWSEPVDGWDDRIGDQLRALGVFALSRILPGSGGAAVVPARRRTDS